ncbi:uncharacterized protein K452DRAFT_285979 [Aplosporella prunicola CBS 121167]|uniref:Uncharacterized protein n=1 Tax=Aplosporella prunicola CBS 121167 TaxID=1176127 RepID=A0A6A6BM72_9PEZI|nr:uncharacterized protein K452DRAFT_285979 [Aplosporella prunicola CBS 121167]KAF2143937.1 hypothetical protein K452DRAFT_285979 [Aplosporella prunicola CBS 121167]
MAPGRIDPHFDPSVPEVEDWDEEEEPQTQSMWDLLRTDPQSAFEALGMGEMGGLPLPSSFPSPDEMREEARERAANIYEHWSPLNQILQRHEATIRKRWLKKTREQRRKILLTAWPSMPPMHRPDFDAFIRESEQQRAAGTSFKDAFTWPYINQEDLLKPRILLLFLNARGRNTPDAFAMADHDAAHFGFVTKALNPAFLNEHTMIFTGRKDPETYGELVSWEEDEEAFDKMLSGVGAHPGHGLIILEMQERIYSFLINCCQQILHEIPPESMTKPEYPIQPEPPSVSENETGYPSLAVIANEAPYRLPADLDLVALEGLLSAKISATEDHIWALREDPGYFADIILEWKEHRQEMLPDWNGEAHPVLKPGADKIFWHRVIGNALTEAYLKLETWNAMREEIRDLERLQRKYATMISPEKELPAEYLNALLRTLHFLDQASKGPIGVLRTGVVASPPIRGNFVREPQEPNSTIIRVQQRPGLEQDKARDRLLWLFNTLWTPEQLFLAGLYTVVDELERLTINEPKAKELVSPLIAGQLSDLAVIAECIRQIKSYHPWAAGFEMKKSERDAQNQVDYAKTTRGWVHFLGVGEGATTAILGNPSDKKFHYPVDKRRTRENVEAMRQAEENLDNFWTTVDRQMKIKTREIEHTAVFRLLSQERMLRRTPEWVEPAKTQKEQLPPDMVKPLSEIYFELERLTERTVDRTNALPAPKQKPKTRGTPGPASPAYASTPASEQAPASTAPPTVAVDKRALKVFSTLFYTPSQHTQPGEVPWPDFLHAMASAGFAPTKLYGSVWQFAPQDCDVQRSIQFHEPHPAGKIPYRMARRHGRRLERAFGWNGGMFALA